VRALVVDQPAVSFNGRRPEKLSLPAPGQRRVFELLGKSIPLGLGLIAEWWMVEALPAGSDAFWS
jgi:hypothetical protein